MNVVVSTNVVSPHIAPLALALRGILGDNSVVYTYTGDPSDTFRSTEVYNHIKTMSFDVREDRDKAEWLLLKADLLYDDLREFEIVERRAERGLTTFYGSERWFKPINIVAPFNSERSKGLCLFISGFLRMLMPFGYKRARHMLNLLEKQAHFRYLPYGIIAARDMARMCGLLHGDWKCLFRAPELDFESKPGGRIWLRNGGDNRRYCLHKMRMWGYFVSPSVNHIATQKVDITKSSALRVLWVGRMFGWKRVDTIIKAVGNVDGLVLDIYGGGPELSKLVQLASNYSNVHCGPPVILSEVRNLMRNHDVYVLASEEFEGWGAVINEAIEEGMKVLGTFEAGACATILPKANLFHAGDWRGLRNMLLRPIKKVEIGDWTARRAAQVLIDMWEDKNV